MNTAESFEEEKEFTLEEFEKLPESVHAEVHEGELVMMGGTSLPHGAILSRLVVSISNQIAVLNSPCEVFSSTCDVLLSTRPLTVFEPDLMIVSDLSRMTRKWYQGAPPIVMEIVSRSSISRDYYYKTAMYGKYGVKEYWIIDLIKEQITVHCFEVDPYPQVYTFQDTVSSNVCKGIRVNFRDIWQDLKRMGFVSGDHTQEDKDV